MDKVKGFMIIVIAVMSVIVTILVANILLDTTNIVNQGNFRISEVVVKSSANLEEVQDKEKTVTKLSDLSFDVTQTNDISIMLEANVEPKKIEIKNLNITSPSLIGEMTICQNGYEKYIVNPELTDLDINVEQQSGKYIINLLLDNNDVLKSVSVDDSVEEIKYDASIFNIINTDVSSLKFNISFDLYVTDSYDTAVKTHINLKMPNDETFSKGMSILKQDTSDFIFTIID